MSTTVGKSNSYYQMSLDDYLNLFLDERHHESFMEFLKQTEDLEEFKVNDLSVSYKVDEYIEHLQFMYDSEYLYMTSGL